jgi:electron transfer flavoprotein beta subunit
MDIVVCVRRVPDLTETELEIDSDGLALDDSDLDYDINEWDDFAIEEAVRLKEKHGGSVLAITVGDEEAEEVLRRALAMGVDEALHLCDDAFEGSDPWAVSSALHRALQGRSFDLLLAGAISSDGTSAHTGGMLAALLGVPQVALVTSLEITDGKAVVRHEVEGGLEREVEVTLPALFTVQSGINEPRYVSIRGIRKVAGIEIATKDAAELGLDEEEVGAAGCRVQLEGLALPPTGDRAEILEGNLDEAVATLVGRLREKGGL